MNYNYYNGGVLLKKKKIDPSKYKIKEGKRLAIPLFMRD